MRQIQRKIAPILIAVQCLCLLNAKAILKYELSVPKIISILSKVHSDKDQIQSTRFPSFQFYSDALRQMRADQYNKPDKQTKYEFCPKSEPILSNSDKFGQIRTNSNEFGQIQMNSDKLEPFRTNSDTSYGEFGQVRAVSPNLPEFARICSKFFKFDYLKIALPKVISK